MAVRFPYQRGFCVARSTVNGNARALKQRNEQWIGSRALFFAYAGNGESTGLKPIFIMHKIALGIAALATLALASCSTVSTGSGMGVLYTGVTEGQIATSNTVGTKVGTSKSTGVLGLVSIGDASIQTAANSAGIKKVSHVDVKKTSILGLFATYQTVVYGE